MTLYSTQTFLILEAIIKPRIQIMEPNTIMTCFQLPQISSDDIIIITITKIYGLSMIH